MRNVLQQLKAIVGDRNARQQQVMQQIRNAGFGAPRKQAITPVVKTARIAWIELFELTR